MTTTPDIHDQLRTMLDRNKTARMTAIRLANVAEVDVLVDVLEGVMGTLHQRQVFRPEDLWELITARLNERQGNAPW